MTKTILKTSATVLLALACAARADGPTSRPSNRPDRTGNDRPDRGDRPMRPWRQQADKHGPVSSEQWTAVLAFMREYSPRRTAEFENLTSLSEPKADFLKQLIAAQYDYVMNLKNDDSKLYDLQLEKIKAQDAIYGMLKDMSGAGMDDGDKKAFHDLVGKLVEVNLDERDRRIEKARESLAKAQTSLEADRKNKDSLINDRIDQFLKEGARPFKLDGPSSPSTRGPRHLDDQVTSDTQAIDGQSKLD